MALVLSLLLLLFFQLEAKVNELSREKDDLEGRVEEDQDEIEELLEKQRNHISQTTSLQTQLTEANMQVEEVEDTKQTLEIKVQCSYRFLWFRRSCIILIVDDWYVSRNSSVGRALD